MMLIYGLDRLPEIIDEFLVCSSEFASVVGRSVLKELGDCVEPEY